ncbi:T9SS type B sorting domain-containing protein [Myroides odoratimimus]|uniref:T9SS type B sorting domain-containing protein n=2 Tax=Myroides odoratimimus TaxID=76832 RepID=UPI001CE1DFA9|nr:T9SS type B sorting domain-containing protein [Myroides odoratimimus]MDO5856560.1 T9SS type B sorting domain-containing protein [Myroides odoratimimus]MDX4974940.1 T9SS type B sorting domain-containing protein [Myroides odoratimimus]MEC4027688.1 T9SS type B sorting domain-containing protein [Myroides odoratimimus]MEC4042011.1 T9SS type B sorting domain-containing protein [Myroides odoratimimus]MEC4075293.1 T9SS type B sorting domain-containing protein [Myroides odoratimimus]
MGKRMWLSLFVFSGVLSVGAVAGGINPFEYLVNREIVEVYNDQDEPKPEVKVGKPHDIEQALPKNSTSGNFRVFLGEAIKNKTTGLVVDAEGNAIVPEGYIYSFHNTQDEANRNTNKQKEILYVDKFNPTTAPLTRFLRVQSVVDATKVTVSPFLIKVKPEEGATLNDRVTGRPDQYQNADKEGNATFVLLEDKNQLYYGNSNTELFKVDGTSKTKLTDAEINKFTTNKNQLIEAKIVLDGETATRQFTLFVEKLKVSGVNPVLESVETRKDDTNRYGNYDLKKTIPALLGTGENPDYYTITFHKTAYDAQRNENPIDISKPYEGAHGTDATARISYKLAKSANPLVSTSQKVVFKVIDKPIIPPLQNVSYCDSKIASYSLTIDGQTKVIADGRTIATDEEQAAEGFDPKGKYSIGYFNSEEDAIANTNKIVGVEITVKLNETRKIWARLTNLEDKNFNTAFFYASLGYDNLKTAEVSTQVFHYCQVENNTGESTVNLRRYEGTVMGKTSITNTPNLNPTDKITTVYYENEKDAEADVNRMPESKVTAYPIKMGEVKGPIYTRVIMTEGFDCKADNYSSFKVSLGVELAIDYFPKESTQQLCINTETNEIAPVVLSVENKDVKGRPIVITWQYEVSRENGWIVYNTVPGSGNQTSIKIDKSGNYRAIASYATSPYPGVQSCSTETIVWTVKAPPVAVVEGVDATGMLNSMEIDEKGETMVRLGVLDGGTSPITDGYDFAIDNSAFQPSSQFYNIPIGEHIAYARNRVTGCSTSVKFSVFGYPKYFTPNGDGYNDTWNIPGLKGHNEARIYIYDRSGRLLKQLSPHTEGWDGTWNGKPMPSTDYWFTVEFVNDFKAPNDMNGRKVSYKGHFSLKR